MVAISPDNPSLICSYIYFWMEEAVNMFSLAFGEVIYISTWMQIFLSSVLAPPKPYHIITPVSCLLSIPCQPHLPHPHIPQGPHEIPIGRPADIPQTFLLEESGACKKPHLQVVAYVHSAIALAKDREETRRTWASSNAVNMTVVFMVGRAKTQKERDIIATESNRYHDIVQVLKFLPVKVSLLFTLSFSLNPFHFS